MKKEEKSYKTFSTRVPINFFNKIEDFIKANDMTKSEFIRSASREYIENHSKER